MIAVSLEMSDEPKIPPYGVIFSDFIAIFAMSIEVCFYTIKLMKILEMAKL